MSYIFATYGYIATVYPQMTVWHDLTKIILLRTLL